MEEKKENSPQQRTEAPSTTAEYEMDLLNTFLETDLTHRQRLGVPKNYLESEERLKKYKEIAGDDEKFADYIKANYGTFENFLLINQKLTENRVYDPETDYDIEVEIITKDQYLKSDFISSTEMFLEVLGGISTIQYFKTNGQITQSVGTLKKSFVPSSEYETREKAFGFYGSPRILMWDVRKQDWVSFYMVNVRRFIRDDTSELQ